MQGCETLKTLAGFDVVIGAIVEDLGAERRLFRRLEQIVGRDTILASNTPSLAVSEIAAACAQPARVAGLQLFTPAPVMKIAEMNAAVRTTLPWSSVCAR